MDSAYLEALAATVPTVCFLLLFLYYLLSKPIKSHIRSNSSCSNKAPEASGAWPVTGHLHLLAGKALPHITLGAMAEKYGPAFTIRLGTRRALVVSSSEVAKQCFTTNDRAFSSRPISIALKIMGYNNSMFGFSPYGQYWRELRKIVVLELLSNRRLDWLKNVWASEIDLSIKDLYHKWAIVGNYNDMNGAMTAVEMKQWFADLTMNIVGRLVAGKRCFGKNILDGEQAEARRCQKPLREFFRLVGVFMVEDALPFLTWFDLQGYQREMKKIARELDSLLQEWLEEHKIRKEVGGTRKGEQDDDFMDVMLSALKDFSITDRDADTINKSTCLTILIAATDTSIVTLTWAVSLLLNNRHVLKKAQEELDAQVGKDRHVEESDIKNLVYLQAIIKEVLRLYPAGPLSGPRESIEDTVVAGYHVPAGMRLIVNLWKIQRDPSTWPDPLEFRPERFLTTHKNTELWGQHFELTPFGSGRRSCPGIPFALRVIPLILARLLHGFELTTPGSTPVDMTESAGLTNVKATSLEVFITPRLPHQLYN